MFCKNCGEVLTDTEVVCRQCGFAAGTGDRYCEQCGTETPAYAVLCEVCGKKVEHDSAMQDMAFQTMPEQQFQQQSQTQFATQQQNTFQSQPVFQTPNVYPTPRQPMQQQRMSVYPTPAANQQSSVYPAPNSRRMYFRNKKKGIYVLLGLLFGSMGVHDFYIGRYKQGFIHLALAFVGGLSVASWIWALIEVLCLSSEKNPADENRNILE